MAEGPAEVPKALSVKFPPKLLVCGMISNEKLSQLHVIPQNTSVDAEYHVESMLEKVCLPAINRTATTGSVLTRCVVERRSAAFSCKTALRLVGLPELPGASPQLASVVPGASPEILGLGYLVREQP